MIVTQVSIRYIITSGEHRGKYCTVLDSLESPMEKVQIVLEESPNKIISIGKKSLLPTQIPGWIEKRLNESYGLDKYKENIGNGTNMLKTDLFAQPRALCRGDSLATGGYLLEHPRMGYNSSVLINASQLGWIELPSRLPLARFGNINWKLPINLTIGDVLATQCKVFKNSHAKKGSLWVNIFIDRIRDGLEVPFCVPIALQ